MRWTWLAVAFLLVPVLEIYVIIQVGQVIGAPWTIALLLLESALGAWIVKREGRRAWAALRTTFSTGRLPGTELADAALVLVGGTLLLTPGFVTDIVGFFFVLPPTRPVARRLLIRLLRVTLVAHSTGRPGRSSRRGHRRTGDRVVPGEIVDDDR
ncbi:MAG TPA: FxsA family protein [Nocardioidaceae bacterium]|jgi:UPF0716 protein FxsA|nr:FxsA family protein [Actinomycetota bacterium]MDQ3423643.1 FxsA family protein [Actinomycetota bacterium]HEV8056285.1 FxsA family protein [Nocardioidaceae bacterium]